MAVVAAVAVGCAAFAGPILAPAAAFLSAGQVVYTTPDPVLPTFPSAPKTPLGRR